MDSRNTYDNPWFQWRYDRSLVLLNQRDVCMGVSDKSLLRLLALQEIRKYRLDPELNEEQAISSGFENAVEYFYREVLEHRPKY